MGTSWERLLPTTRDDYLFYNPGRSGGEREERSTLLEDSYGQIEVGKLVETAVGIQFFFFWGGVGGYLTWKPMRLRSSATADAGGGSVSSMESGSTDTAPRQSSKKYCMILYRFRFIFHEVSVRLHPAPTPR